MRHPLLELILVSLAATACGKKEEGIGCFPVDETVTECPPFEDVEPTSVALQADCDNKIIDVVGDHHRGIPEVAFQDGSIGCCYEVLSRDTTPNSECIVGRLYRDEGKAVAAQVPSSDPWATVAAGEHASVAAFARLQLQLMAHGAPLELVRRVAEAMLDEVRHTAVALRFTPLEALGPLPLTEHVDPTRPLAELAADAVRDGCVGETLSALLTREAARRATTPEEREALEAIANDEDRHAALSWALVAWAVRAGGDPVETAVREAFAAPHTTPGFPLLDANAIADVLAEGLERVLRPAAAVLLAA